MNTAIIGLGSNINPEDNIQLARTILAEQYHVLGESSFITTKPIGYTHQADFINGSVYLKTDQSRDTLSSELKQIEQNLGRERSAIKFGPRSIDLDIIIWNDCVVDQDYYDRPFLQKAVKELIPEFAGSSPKIKE